MEVEVEKAEFYVLATCGGFEGDQDDIVGSHRNLEGEGAIVAGPDDLCRFGLVARKLA